MDNKVHVGICSDRNYIHFVKIAIVSILDNYRDSRELVIHLVHNGLTKSDVQELEALKRFGAFTLDAILIDSVAFAQKWGATHPTYWRFALMAACENCDKLIYLDCDLVVLDDISKLYDVDLQGHTLGAVGDRAGLKVCEKIGVPHQRYFNAGVLLINLKKLRDENALERLCSENHRLAVKLLFMDQDLLNSAYKNDLVLLPQKWNIINSVYRNMPLEGMYTVEDVIEAVKSTGIAHFTGSHKPWKVFKTTHHPFAHKFWKYALMAPVPSGFKWKIRWKMLLTGRFKDAGKKRPWSDIPLR